MSTTPNVVAFRKPAPRREEIRHHGTKITIVYDVAARLWRWAFTSTVTAKFTGEASTLDAAKKAAIKKVDEVLG